MKEYAGLILPLLVTVFGWFILSFLSDRQKRKQDQKEKMYSFLTEAYFTATSIRSNDFNSIDELMSMLFELTGKVSLYGSEKQISLLSDFFSELGAIIQSGDGFNSSDELHELIKALREDVRNHLGLPKLTDGVPSTSKGVKYNAQQP